MQRQKYYYDSLNQLIREDNLDLNKTFVYSYDLGGNITSTKEYAYQTGAAVTGSPTTTNTYTYGDSNWKDKLTAYNGNTITYDQIGNPLSYRNGFTFTWQKGRQLASATNGTTSVSYTYNNDGYRTSKTVDGTTTDYTLEGSKVLIEKTGSDYIWYYYDAAEARGCFLSVIPTTPGARSLRPTSQAPRKARQYWQGTRTSTEDIAMTVRQVCIT